MLAGGCGHQQRRGETNRRGGGERHPADRDDEDEVADQHSASTARAEHRAAASPASAGHSAAKYDQHDDQVPGKAGPDDLHDRVVRGQQFDRGVHEREHRDAEAHQRDAAQHVGGRQCRRRPAALPPARRRPRSVCDRKSRYAVSRRIFIPTLPARRQCARLRAGTAALPPIPEETRRHRARLISRSGWRGTAAIPSP